jgi:hypothetical protein
MVYGERIMVFSGEFHPYRLPVPDLWLDVFQKIKALGFNAVSFYVHWALLEGKPGHYSAEGVFAFEPFFAAAKEAGIYLIARPGPVSKTLAIHKLMLILCSISMRNPVEEASLDGFKGSRGNSERGLLTIWLQLTTMWLTLVQPLQRHKLPMEGQSSFFSQKTSTPDILET